jgi:hypothetical protein
MTKYLSLFGDMLLSRSTSTKIAFAIVVSAAIHSVMSFTHITKTNIQVSEKFSQINHNKVMYFISSSDYQVYRLNLNLLSYKEDLSTYKKVKENSCYDVSI